MDRVFILYKIALLIFGLLIPIQASAYTNPVSTGSGADPSVLLHNGTYYFYATNDGSVYSSTDLVNWTKGPKVYPEGVSGLWAPDVYYHPEDGKFYMHYTKDYYLYVAVSDAPDRQFTLIKTVFVNALDSHLFRDDDGSLYLYFVRIPGSLIYGTPMSDPATLAGPFALLLQPDVAWELNGSAINEGPWMLKHNGKYHLMYSGSDAQTIDYAVGIATSDSPTGPFTKYSGNPVIQDLANNVWGPGHGSVTRDREGALWHLYHQKSSTQDGWARYICLDPVGFDQYDVFYGTPTKGSSQTNPVTDANLVWSPDVSPRGGSFEGLGVVKLTSHTDNAEIRYTLDGSEPDQLSLLFADSLILDHDATVKAKAFKKGMTASTVSSQAYTVTGGTGIRGPEITMPITEAGPTGYYDMAGKRYGTSTASRLPQGVYFSISDGFLVKVLNLGGSHR